MGHCAGKIYDAVKIMNLFAKIAVLATSGAAAGAGLWLLLRKWRKSASEQERERRLAVNSVGRLTDGTLLEAPDSAGEAGNLGLLFYQYSVAGVKYSAAQDIDGLNHRVRLETCSPGATVTVKYDRRNSLNSIIVCELWNGLSADGGKETSEKEQKTED